MPSRLAPGCWTDLHSTARRAAAPAPPDGSRVGWLGVGTSTRLPLALVGLEKALQAQSRFLPAGGLGDSLALRVLWPAVRHAGHK